MSETPILDPEARIRILSGDTWGPWLARALREARQSVLLSVYMISHHWRVPNRHRLNLLAELADCAKRGLTCRCITAASETMNTREAFNRTAATELQAAGWKVRPMTGPRLLHEKIILIDRRLTLIGSHNISKASLTSNHDTSVAIESETVAKETFRLFWQRWRETGGKERD